MLEASNSADSAARESSNGGSVPKSRPYRSHRFPACSFCRRRKSRCTRDSIDGPCLLCRTLGLACSSSSSSSTDHARRRSEIPIQPSKKRKGESLERQDDELPDRSTVPPNSSPPCNLGQSPIAMGLFPVNVPQVTPDSPEQSKQTHSGHIVGPTLARDAQVLEQYMLPAVSQARPNPYSVYSDDPRNPVVYLKVPRQRGIFPVGNGTPAFRQLETMEKLLEPLGPNLFQTYFDSFHPSFPILDEKTVAEAYRHDGLPHALVCEIYAVSLISWSTSSKIMRTRPHRPDIKYMWNLAVSALNEDFLSPSFSTVLTCLLDLIGRPTTSITYNAVNIGRCVALSHSLGLNRNPSNWNLDQRQKSLRIRTWWGLLIHDTWASLSHGTPMHISRSEWDIPLPDLECLQISTDTDGGAGDRLQGAHSFIALCQLTEILGDMLPLIYTLHPKESNSLKTLRRLEILSDEWEDSLPVWLNPISSGFEREASGALNLQLSFLAVKMCMCRVALHEAARSNDSDEREIQLYHQLKCRKAAIAVIDFVTSLRSEDTTAFWLPYSAYHFTSTATLILRCALESENDATAQECVHSASTLLGRLRHLKTEANWDLGDMCLDHCGDIVTRMSDGDYLEFRRRNQHAAGKKPTNPEVSSTKVKPTSQTTMSVPQKLGDQEQTSQSLPTSLDVENSNLQRNDLNAPNLGSATSFRSFGFYNPTILDQGYSMDQEFSPFADFWQFPQMDASSSFL